MVENEMGLTEIVEGIYVSSLSEMVQFEIDHPYENYTDIDCRDGISRWNEPHDNLKVAKFLAEKIHKAREAGDNVMIFCECGVERSPLVAVVYLRTYHSMGFDKAYDLIRSKRKNVARRPGWLPDDYIKWG